MQAFMGGFCDNPGNRCFADSGGPVKNKIGDISAVYYPLERLAGPKQMLLSYDN